jgi:hypothetical protein
MGSAELADHRLDVTMQLAGLIVRPVGMVGEPG